MFSYNKHKDSNPQRTVQKIQQILQQIGLQTSVEWSDSGLQGACANRVTLTPTSIGTNGKGTDRDYALASGYAELIERLENGLLIPPGDSHSVEEGGFITCPDEAEVPVQQVMEQRDPFTRFIFSRFLLFTEKGKRAFLTDPIWDSEGKEKDTLHCIPYADLSGNRVVYMPAFLLLNFYGSNGMASGNTMEEALVQGISEIIERYTHKAVIDGVVPPEIPRDYLEQFQIIDLIRQIENDGRYRVRVLDCSLGREIPATAAVISDLEKGTFGVSFSSHPSFEVSIERAFTEAFQGNNLEQFTSMNGIASEEDCHRYNNYPNLMKVGLGVYPLSFLSGEPSYPFQPWKEWRYSTNTDMLKQLLEIIRREGFDVLVRDSSHLGFPAYQVVVPGMSEIFPPCDELIREARTHARVIESLSHFPDLNDEEEKRLLLFLRFKESSAMEHSFSAISGIPITEEEMTSEKITAYLHYQRKEYEKAIPYFQALAEQQKDKNQSLFFRCAAEYARLRMIGASGQEAFAALKVYYPLRTAEDVHVTMENPSGVMKKVFKPFPCPDCAHCSFAGVQCENPEVEKLRQRVKAALAKSTVSQQKLLEDCLKIL